MSEEARNLSLEDRLALVSRNLDKESHIEVDQKKFRYCGKRPPILFVCPSKTYTLNEETGECVVNFENCLECGTCQVACPEAVTWKNPSGGFGITLKWG